MEKFVTFSSKVVPLAADNVDTDQIIPARYLTSIVKSGFGEGLFHDWRFKSDGTVNESFVLNQPRYKDAKILLAKQNFGCGSSREHAAWALLDYGFKVVIASSFGDIFKMNSGKNGLLTIQLSEDQISELFTAIEAVPGTQVTVNLEEQKVCVAHLCYQFEYDAFRKMCLINGYDDLEYMRSKTQLVEQYEKANSK
jgi:3-isopropylmalate/(R)-2-methylmalate dehydratase small subunit